MLRIGTPVVGLNTLSWARGLALKAVHVRRRYWEEPKLRFEVGSLRSLPSVRYNSGLT
jgi:hypothetical protein